MKELIGDGVPPDGSPSARVWAFGEAPGATEQRIGKVFVGPAGRHLDLGLRDASILRGELFIWNIFSKRPPGNNINHYFEDKDNRVLTFEGQQMVTAVRMLIQQYKPYVIIALGAVPLYVLTGKKRITKWRGSVLDCVLCPGVKVYPTYHPSYVMRLMQERGERDKKMAQNVYPTFVRDLQRAWAQSASRSFPSIQRRHILPETVGEVVSYLEWLRELSEPISCDIEDIPLDPELPVVTRVGFAPTPNEGISIPFLKNGAVCWTLDEWATILQEISRLFLEGPRIIFQRGIFDLTILGYLFGLRLREPPLDTEVQQHCAYPHLPKSLEYQTSVYTLQPYYKDDRKKYKAGQITEDSLSVYNITDCCTTKEIQPITLADIEAMGMRESYDRTISLFPSLLFMMLQGVRVDTEVRDRIAKDFKKKQATAMAAIEEINGGPMNPKSSQQVIDLLYVKLRFPKQFHPKTGKVTSDVDALNRLEMKMKHPIFQHIRDHRKYSKLLGTYIEMGISDKGRMHTEYDPTGTVTWRLASRESSLGGGGDLQNIPKRDEEGREIRKMFVPDPGYLMIAADYRQAEDMYVNWKAGDERGIADYLAGKDPHWENCKLFFDLPPDLQYDKGNPDHWNMRNKLTKHANHANNYDMGPKKFRELLVRAGYTDYTMKDCKDLQALIKNRKPMIEAWKAWVRRKVTTDRTIVTALGRKRVFYGRISDDLFRKAYAQEPQSTVGELMNEAIKRVHDRLFEDGLRILLNNHDELIMQVPLGEGSPQTAMNYWAPRLRREMEIPIQVEDIYGQVRELTIPIDISYGKSWGELEDWKD